MTPYERACEALKKAVDDVEDLLDARFRVRAEVYIDEAKGNDLRLAWGRKGDEWCLLIVREGSTSAERLTNVKFEDRVLAVQRISALISALEAAQDSRVAAVNAAVETLRKIAESLARDVAH